MKTSDMKNASAKSQRSDTKHSDAKVGRLRSQSEEREERPKLSANKSRPQIKLTIPHTPQLLKWALLHNNLFYCVRLLDIDGTNCV